jgi:hypothetical protein
VKKTLLILVGMFPLYFLSAQVVTIEMKKSELKTEDKIIFDIICLSEQDLEITVFSSDCLVSQQKAILPAEQHHFELTENPCKPGKYFILVTGNKIHIEKEFTIQ